MHRLTVRVRRPLVRHLVFLATRCHASNAIPVHVVLHAEEGVAERLEKAADFEGPGDLTRGREEPEDLHPSGQDSQEFAR